MVGGAISATGTIAGVGVLAGQNYDAVKKWLDRVIRKMIQGGK